MAVIEIPTLSSGTLAESVMVGHIRGKICHAVEDCQGNAAVLRNSFRKISEQIDTLRSPDVLVQDEINSLSAFLSGLRNIIGH